MKRRSSSRPARSRPARARPPSHRGRPAAGSAERRVPAGAESGRDSTGRDSAGSDSTGSDSTGSDSTGSDSTGKRARGKALVESAARGNGRSSTDMAEHLLDCALTVFAERGYDATSVRDILRAAGVTQPTLYYYFPSKQALFLQLSARHGSETLERLRAALAPRTSCEARLRVVAEASFVACGHDPRIPRLLFQTTFGPRIPGISAVLDELAARRFALVRAIIQEGCESGELAPSSVDGLTLAFCCLLDQHLNVLVRQPHPAQLLSPELAGWLVTLFLRGAGANRA